MKSLTVLYDRLIRCGASCREAWELCGQVEKYLKGNHQLPVPFQVEFAGGWIFGDLTDHGAVLGRQEDKLGSQAFGPSPG
jgi:hypothetical protein